MGLNSDIIEVIAQIDKIITGKTDKWLNISDYNIKSRDRKNMKSIYGLIHNILHHKPLSIYLCRDFVGCSFS